MCRTQCGGKTYTHTHAYDIHPIISATRVQIPWELQSTVLFSKLQKMTSIALAHTVKSHFDTIANQVNHSYKSLLFLYASITVLSYQFFKHFQTSII